MGGEGDQHVVRGDGILESLIVDEAVGVEKLQERVNAGASGLGY